MTDWTEDAEQQGWEDELELHLATHKAPPDRDVSEPQRRGMRMAINEKLDPIDVLTDDVALAIVSNRGLDIGDDAAGKLLNRINAETAFRCWCEWTFGDGGWGSTLARVYENIKAAYPESRGGA